MQNKLYTIKTEGVPSENLLDRELIVTHNGENVGMVEISENPSGTYMYDFKTVVDGETVHTVGEHEKIALKVEIEFDMDRTSKKGRIKKFIDSV